jgi:hypothetical protein
MASDKELVLFANIARAISTAENENDVLRALGLKKSEELQVFWEFLLSQVDSNKEIYLFMLGLSEEELLKELDEFGWREILWKNKWEEMDRCGCCFSSYPAGFYGKAPFCEGGSFKIIPKNILFKIVQEAKKKKKIYQY